MIDQNVSMERRIGPRARVTPRRYPCSDAPTDDNHIGLCPTVPDVGSTSPPARCDVMLSMRHIRSAWPRNRWWALAKWVLGVLLGGGVFLSGLSVVVTPALIWSHTAGVRTPVRGTEVTSAGRYGNHCKGWVIPPGAPVPVHLFDKYYVLGLSAQDRQLVHQVDVKGGPCTDGDYWARRAGAAEVWTRSPTASTLLTFIAAAGLALAGLESAVWAARRCIAVVRGSPSAGGRDDQEFGERRWTPALNDRRAEPLLLRTAVVLAMMVAMCTAGLTGFVVPAILVALIAPDAVDTLVPLFGLAGSASAVLGFGWLNRRVSHVHRQRVRHKGGRIDGVIAACRERAIARPRSRTFDYWVTLTVQFNDPAHGARQWLRRSYRFKSSEIDDAFAFAHTHAEGTASTVYRSRRKIWYVLDVDDRHLSWPLWW